MGNATLVSASWKQDYRASQCPVQRNGGENRPGSHLGQAWPAFDGPCTGHRPVLMGNALLGSAGPFRSIGEVALKMEAEGESRFAITKELTSGHINRVALQESAVPTFGITKKKAVVGGFVI